VADSDTIGPTRAQHPLVLALDIGSSSIRGAIHDSLGRTVQGTVVQLRYEWETAPDGAVRLAPDTFLTMVGAALDALDASVGRLRAEIVAGGIDCFVHSIVGLDGKGRPVTTVLSWADTTSAADAAALRRRLDPVAVHATTGAPIHAGYWPARILRLRSEQPGIRRWAGLPELVAGTLTGRLAVTRSMASGTGLLDRAKGTWAGGMLEAVEVGPGDLSPIVADNEAMGPLSSAAVARWPRLARVPWFGAWGDGGCGNVGLGATGPGRAALMVGTSGALRTIVHNAAPALPAGLFAQRLGPGTVVGGQLSEGGGTLAWVSRLMGRSQASLERAAASLDPDSHGLTVLPYTFGERGLGYHDSARASVVGLAPGTDAVAVYRAFLESIALGFAAVDHRLSDVLGAAPAIVASGGALERSDLFGQVLADSLGRAISVAAGLESSRRGAALLALWGSGHLADIAAAPEPPTRTIHADPDRTALYRAARARREALYGTLLA
jgi:gluconokinase